MGAASPLWVLGLAALLVLPGLRLHQRRLWLLLYMVTLALFLGLQALPGLVPGERLLGPRWNWSGSLLGLAGTLWVAAQLARRAGLSWREMGFTHLQQPGSLRQAVVVSAAALALNGLVLSLDPVRGAGVPAETWAYQATLPGLVEEAVFRGLLLALLDRAYTRRRALLGVGVGWGGVVITIVFLALHGFSAGMLLSVLPAALLALWLRLRTGSLVLPVVVHNLWNLSLYAAHL